MTRLPLCDQVPAKPSKYEVATITEVNAHQDSGSHVLSHDVSVEVGDAVYVVLYTPPFGMNTVKYAAGSGLLVLVGEKTITYSHMLGDSHGVPIVSRRSAAKRARPPRLNSHLVND